MARRAWSIVSYTPYGERRFAGPGTSANNWRYIGSDEELASFYSHSARHYDATIGRFTQMDPSGQETAPYYYASCDPVNRFDDTGLCDKTTEAIALTAAALGTVLIGATNPWLLLASVLYWDVIRHRSFFIGLLRLGEPSEKSDWRARCVRGRPE